MRLAPILLILVLLVPAAAANYTHLMGDAGRTATVDAGPDHPDAGWRVSINGTRSALQPPMAAPSGGSTYQALVASFLIDACSGPCSPDWIWHRDAATRVRPSSIEHQLLFEGAEASRGTPRVNYGYFSIWVLDAETGVPVWDDRGETWASVPRDEGDLILPEHDGDVGYAHAPRIHEPRAQQGTGTGGGGDDR